MLCSESRQKLISSTAQTSSISHTEDAVLCNTTGDNTDYREEQTSNQLTLNADADEFVPECEMSLTSSGTSPLFTIKEEIEHSEVDHDDDSDLDDDKEDVCHWKAKQLYDIKDVLKKNAAIYIPEDVTEEATTRRMFHVYFPDSSDLFNYAKHQCIRQVIDKEYKLFAFVDTDGAQWKELVIFNPGLYTKDKNHMVYVVGNLYYRQNEKGETHRHKYIKWKMERFMTSSAIFKEYNIPHDLLPGNKKRSPLLKQKHMRQWTARVALAELQQIGQISARKSSSELIEVTVTADVLRERMMTAINGEYFWPIISFDKNHRNYYIDLMLRIKIKGYWIGVTFGCRKIGNKTIVKAVKFCLDATDIRRKLVLFQPCVTGNEYPRFDNIHTLRITETPSYRCLPLCIRKTIHLKMNHERNQYKSDMLQWILRSTVSEFSQIKQISLKKQRLPSITVTTTELRQSMKDAIASDNFYPILCFDINEEVAAYSNVAAYSITKALHWFNIWLWNGGKENIQCW